MRLRINKDKNQIFIADQNGMQIHLGQPDYSESGPKLLDVSITNYCTKECNYCYKCSSHLILYYVSKGKIEFGRKIYEIEILYKSINFSILFANEHYKTFTECNKQLERIMKELRLTPLIRAKIRF